MKRTALFAMIALLSGFVLGISFGSTSPDRGAAPALAADLSGGAADPIPVADIPQQLSASSTPLDPLDNTRLAERAGQVLEAMKAGDYPALAALVSPEHGVTFTPYSTVNRECDLCLTAQQISKLDSDPTMYVWGLADGSGAPIKLTGTEYFAQYVFNADYTQAPYLSIDEVLVSGNAMENVADSYPEGRFVEYYFPGLDPQMEVFDWCSLKLVFQVWQEDWYLVGLIHGQWTI